MTRFAWCSAPTFVVAATLLSATAAQVEILALVNFESKPAEALKAYSSPVRGQTRTEAIAILDVDPQSPGFGKIVREISLPGDLVAHHIFYNRDSSKIYVTSLGKAEMRVIDMKDPSLPMKTVAVPACQVGEDVVFSELTGCPTSRSRAARPRSRSCSFRARTRRLLTSPTCTGPSCGRRPGIRRSKTLRWRWPSTSPNTMRACRWRCTSPTITRACT